MLVLSRKKQESVVVGREDGLHRLLKVTVLEVGNGKVKLGFEVDSAIPVHRLEVWERLEANGELNGFLEALEALDPPSEESELLPTSRKLKRHVPRD